MLMLLIKEKRIVLAAIHTQVHFHQLGELVQVVIQLHKVVLEEELYKLLVMVANLLQHKLPGIQLSTLLKQTVKIVMLQVVAIQQMPCY